MRLYLIFSIFTSSVFPVISLTIQNENDLIFPSSDRQSVATNDDCVSNGEWVDHLPCNPSLSVDLSANDKNPVSLNDFNLDVINPENSAFASKDNKLSVNDGSTDWMVTSSYPIADASGYGIPWGQAPRSIILIAAALLGLVYDSLKNLFYWPKKTPNPGENGLPTPQPSPENSQSPPPPPRMNFNENLCPYFVVGPRTHAVCDAGDVETILLLLDTSDVNTLTINLISTTPYLGLCPTYSYQAYWCCASWTGLTGDRIAALWVNGTFLRPEACGGRVGHSPAST